MPSKDVWIDRVAAAYLMATACIISNEQREYLAHRYDEHVLIGAQPMITAAVKVLVGGIPGFEYVRKG